MPKTTSPGSSPLGQHNFRAAAAASAPPDLRLPAPQQQQQRRLHSATGMSVTSPSSSPLQGNHKIVPSWDKAASISTTVTTTGTSLPSPSWSAMEYSQQASKLLREEKYADSLSCYQHALALYTNTSTSAVVVVPNGNNADSNNRQIIRMVNAAGCLRNMGAIHKLVKRYQDAIPCWQRAEGIYRECQALCVLQLDKDEQKSSCETITTTTTTPPEEFLCLDSLILETLQSRASLHLKHGNQFGPAMQCHVSVLEHLLDLVPQQQWQHPSMYTCELEGVAFGPLDYDKLAEHCLFSLDALVSLMRKATTLQVAFPDTHVSTMQAAWCLLTDRVAALSAASSSAVAAATVAAAASIKLQSRILTMTHKLVPALVDANMHDSVLQLLQSLHAKQPEELGWCALWDDVGQRLEQRALATDAPELYDVAVDCFEKALFARSQCCGAESLPVAQSLVHVGRSMEAQGNVEGARDLFAVAHTIYTAQMDAPDWPQQAPTILQLVPVLMEWHQWQDAVTYLTRCLEHEEDVGGDDDHDGSSSKGHKSSKPHQSLDKAQIYFDLGRSYMGLEDYVSATVCLVEAAKQEGDVNEEQVFALLQRVEFLQRRKQQRQQARCDDDAVSENSSRPSSTASQAGEEAGEESETEVSESDHHAMIKHAIVTSKTEGETVDSSTRGPGTDTELVGAADAAASQNQKALAAHKKRELAATPTTMFTMSGSRDENTLITEHHEEEDTTDDDRNMAGVPSPAATTSRALTKLTDGSAAAAVDDDHSSYQADAEQVSVSRIHDSTADDDFDSTTSAYDPDEAIIDRVHNADHDAHTSSEVSSSVLSSERFSDAMSPSHSIEPLPGDAASLAALRQSSDGMRISSPRLTKDVAPTVPLDADGSPDSFGSPNGDDVVGSASRHTSSASKLSLAESDALASQDGSGSGSFKKKLGGLRLGMGSPRRLKESQEGPAGVKSRSFTNKFRRRRRDGFESLPEEKELDNNQLPLPNALDFEQEYHTSFDGGFDGPIPFVSVQADGGPSFDDNVSQVTFMLDSSHKPRDRNTEWWWGINAEGFGRWFPTSYVSKAVEAAEGFLSAKAIHSKVKSAPLHMGSDDESIEERDGGDDGETPSNEASQDSKKSGGQKQEMSGSPKLAEGDELAWAHIPRQESIIASSSPRRKKREKELRTEIEAQTEFVDLQKKELGKSHPRLATSLYDLAVLQRRDSKIDAATDCANDALQIQKMAGSLKEAANTLHLLADLAMQRERFKMALAHYSDALRMERRKYGSNSEETARTLNCIGTVRSLQNEFGLAMKSHQEALRILKECHGDRVKDPLVSQTLCQIGSVYYRERNSLTTIKSKNGDYSTFIEGGMLEVIGRAHEDRGSYKMAIAFFEEKLQFLENVGEGSSSPTEELATTLNSLGMLSARAGLYFEAIDYYERALTIQRQLGCDDVYLATARVLTGTVQYQLGHWNEAIRMLEGALAVLQSELGSEHETVAATHFQVGVVYASLCQYEQAMSALQTAFATQKKLLGAGHPATLRTQREIGNMYAVYEAEIDSAFEQFRTVLAAQRRIHGDKHPNIAETLHSMGWAFARKGDYTNAVRWLEESYYMRLEFLGVDHPLQATTLHEISKIHLARGRVKKAIEICNVVLGIRKESLSEQHIDVARALATKAHCLSDKGNFNAALKYFNEALPMAENAVGAAHPAVADIQVQLGMLYLNMCQFGDARGATSKALDVYRRNKLDEDHPGIREALELLNKVHRDESLYV